MEIKAKVYTYCQTFITERLSKIIQQIENVSVALTSESKSSAGDKHETGRAMLQLEREKLGAQLKEAEEMKSIINRANIGLVAEKIALGSLVITDDAHYFIGISAGLYKFNQKDVYCISASTPIGQLLMGKSAGQKVCFKDKVITIDQIQ